VEVFFDAYSKWAAFKNFLQTVANRATYHIAYKLRVMFEDSIDKKKYNTDLVEHLNYQKSMTLSAIVVFIHIGRDMMEIKMKYEHNMKKMQEKAIT